MKYIISVFITLNQEMQNIVKQHIISILLVE